MYLSYFNFSKKCSNAARRSQVIIAAVNVKKVKNCLKNYKDNKEIYL